MAEQKAIKKAIYQGRMCHQKAGALQVFARFFERETFDKVIELGTGNGVFTSFLVRQGISHGFETHSFDVVKIRDSETWRKITDLGGKIYLQDVLSKANRAVIKLLEEGRILLLCDNGNKIKEWHFYSPYLKESDVIMAHDYFPGGIHTKEATTHSRRVWKSIEIRDANVKKINEKLNLQPFWAEEFTAVVWLSRIKKSPEA